MHPRTLDRLYHNDTTLAALYVVGDPIGDAAAQALAGALRENTTLTLLYLGNNQIGEVGAQALADALRTNTTLTTLGLGMNDIGDVGAQALAGALRANKTLTSLGLDFNHIRCAGAQALADALLVNTTLTTLYLGGNQLGAVAKAALARAIIMSGRRENIRVDIVDQQALDAAAATAIKHENCRAAVDLLLRAWRSIPNPSAGKDIRQAIARRVWATRDDDAWLPRQPRVEGEPPAQQRRLNDIVCSRIDCSAEKAPQWAEEGNPSKAYCGSYCQMLHYTGLPDLRTASVEQLLSAWQ
jgi:Leucine Rich repeat